MANCLISSSKSYAIVYNESPYCYSGIKTTTQLDSAEVRRECCLAYPKCKAGLQPRERNDVVGLAAAPDLSIAAHQASPAAASTPPPSEEGASQDLQSPTVNQSLWNINSDQFQTWRDCVYELRTHIPPLRRRSEAECFHGGGGSWRKIRVTSEKLDT